MLKRDELADPGSCLNRAEDGEPIFVLLGRDADAPDTVEDWCLRRVRRGKSRWSDPDIQEALAATDRMRKYRRRREAAEKQ